MREKKKGSQVIWPKWGKLPHSISKMTLEIKTWCCFINSFNSLGSLMHLIEKQVVEKGSSKWIGKTESDARTSRRLEPRNAMKEPSRKWPSKKCDMTDTHKDKIHLLRQWQKVIFKSNYWLDNCNFLPYEIHNICNQQQNRSRQWKLWICALIKQSRNDHHRCQRYQEAIFLEIIKPRSNWCVSFSLSVVYCALRFLWHYPYTLNKQKKWQCH